MKISELCNGELYFTLTYFKEFCKIFSLDYRQSKAIYRCYYQEALLRGLNNFPILKELL